MDWSILLDIVKLLCLRDESNEKTNRNQEF